MEAGLDSLACKLKGRANVARWVGPELCSFIDRLLPNICLLCLSLGWTKKLMVRKLEDDLDWALTRTLPLSSKLLFDTFLLHDAWQWPFQLPTGKDVPVYPWTIRPWVDGKLCGRLLQESSCREHPSSKISFVSPRSTFQFWRDSHITFYSSDDLVQLCVDYLKEYPLLVGSGLACPVIFTSHNCIWDLFFIPAVSFHRFSYFWHSCGSWRGKRRGREDPRKTKKKSERPSKFNTSCDLCSATWFVSFQWKCQGVEEQ